MLKICVCFCVITSFLVTWCSSHKILVVFPVPGKSHSILGNAFVETLLDGGHEVTFITAIPFKSNSSNLRQIDVSQNFEVMPVDDVMNITKLINKEIDLFDLTEAIKMMNGLANNTLNNENVKRLLNNRDEQFDIVLVEWMYTELYSGFAAVYDCPLVWSSSMDPHYLVTSLIDEDINPIYTADVYTKDIPPYTFFQRVQKIYSYATNKYKKWVATATEEKIYKSAFTPAMKIRNRSLPSYDEARFNGSLMFGNSHVSSGQSIRLPQNYIPIAGYHIVQNVEPLPKNLKQIMDNAKSGVIYFSMGSMMKSKDLPEYIKNSILGVLSELKQTVIWKFEEELPGKPENVHIVKWAPQPSILAHKNCILFITHGGLLSTTEALHYGVPVIGIPIFADQFNNVNRAFQKGFGRRVDFDSQFAVALKEAIEDIVSNSSYRRKAQELSFAYHHRIAPPRAEILHWVDFAVRTRGCPHLRSPALDTLLYQKLFLDVAAFVLFIVFITAYYCCYTCYRVVFCSRTRKFKVN